MLLSIASSIIRYSAFVVSQNQFTSSDVMLVAVQLNSGACGSEKKRKPKYFKIAFKSVHCSKTFYLTLIESNRQNEPRAIRWWLYRKGE